MSIKKLLEEIELEVEVPLVVTGFDAAIIGVVYQYGRPPVVLYDFERVIGKLMDDGMRREEAEEYYSYNIEGAYMGDFTPAFARIIKK